MDGIQSSLFQFLSSFECTCVSMCGSCIKCKSVRVYSARAQRTETHLRSNILGFLGQHCQINMEIYSATGLRGYRFRPVFNSPARKLCWLILILTIIIHTAVIPVPVWSRETIKLFKLILIGINSLFLLFLFVCLLIINKFHLCVIFNLSDKANLFNV